MGEMTPLFGRKTEINYRFRKGAIIFLFCPMDYRLQSASMNVEIKPPRRKGRQGTQRKKSDFRTFGLSDFRIFGRAADEAKR